MTVVRNLETRTSLTPLALVTGAVTSEYLCRVSESKTKLNSGRLNPHESDRMLVLFLDIFHSGF